MPRVTLMKMLGNRKKKKRQGKNTHTHTFPLRPTPLVRTSTILCTHCSHIVRAVLCLYHRTMQKQMSKGHVT